MTNFEAVFPSSEHLEESSRAASVDASSAAGVEEAGACVMSNGVAAVSGASGLGLAFGVRDFSLGPWPLALTLIFRHLSYVSKPLQRS